MDPKVQNRDQVRMVFLVRTASASRMWMRGVNFDVRQETAQRHGASCLEFEESDRRDLTVPSGDRLETKRNFIMLGK